MLASLRRNFVWHTFALVLVAFLGSCSSGGGTVVVNPNLLPPSVFGLSKNAANPGESVDIIGSNFGATQSDGTVTLNGVQFTITSWTESKIEAVISAGMTSGVLVVRRNGLSSQNGLEAQLTIGQAPPTTPLIFSINPDTARIGTDSVTLIGVGFGAFDAASGVFFTAAPSAGVAEVQATVATNPATGDPQWTASSVKVNVPALAATGDVFIRVAGDESNHLAFVALPPTRQLDDPLINDITPTSGPIDTEIIISGNNFGHAQGNSQVAIDNGQGNSKLLNITEWGNTQIRAHIPTGAVTGKIRVVIGGKTFEFPTQFIVANVPLITGVAPSDLKVGLGTTIHGQFFGPTPGHVTIGATDVPVASWEAGKLVIDNLPVINASDVDDVPVTVTADNGQVSSPFSVKLTSDLIGQVNVSPKTGVATKTNFTFTVSVAGGSGSYSYTLIPDSTQPATTVAGASSSISYKYPASGDYLPQVKVKDNVTNDIKLLDAPALKVGGANDVVITGIETVDFGRSEIAENKYSRVFTNPADPTSIVYHDFVFLTGGTPDTWFTSGTYDLQDGSGNVLESFTRDQATWLANGTSPKPYGYRHGVGAGAAGGKVRLRGYNFGSGPGEIWLNSTGPGNGIKVPDANINAGTWGAPLGEEQTIEFTIPASQPSHLSGTVVVVNNAAVSGKSIDPLVVSPLITLAAPPTVKQDATLQINGYDFSAPGIQGVVGTQTYVFWIAQASYADPFQAGNPSVTKPVLIVNPYPVTVTNGNQINFDMTTLGATANVEVANANFTQFATVNNAALQTGAYQFFLWSGALVPDSFTSKGAVANSGVMSETFAVTVDPPGGGGGNNPPTVNLVANPNSGPSPLNVNFTATANDPDGDNIVSYDWDFDNDGTVDDTTAVNTNSHSYSPDGNYTCKVTVTDDGAPPKSGSGTAPITVGGGGGGNVWTIYGKTVAWDGPQPGGGSHPINGIHVECRKASDDSLVASDISHNGSFGGAPPTDGYFEFTGVPEDDGTNGGYYMQPTDPVPSGDPAGWNPPPPFMIPVLTADRPTPGFADRNNF